MSDLLNIFNEMIVITFDVFRDAVFPIVKTWWWAALPFVTIPAAKDGWLTWKQTDAFRDRDYIVIEFILPDDIIKPIKAMEDVFSSFYSVAFEHKPAVKRETWLEGETAKFMTFSFEIVGDSGKIRFFMRIESHLLNQVSSIVHAQYPSVEIREVEDYVLDVPQDIPNNEWELEHRAFELNNKNVYPIKTYKEFFEAESVPKEEKRIDPLARLFESFSHLKKDERIWLQFNLTHDGDEWKEEGEKIRDSLAKRKEKKGEKQKPMLQEMVEFFLFGVQEEEPGKDEGGGLSPETTLTPGEKETLASVDKKMSKRAFKCSARFLYIAKKESMFKPHMGFPFAFTNSLTSQHQYFGIHAPSNSKVHSLIKIGNLDKQRAFLKKRQGFEAYKMRVNPTFPSDDATFILNAEELATIFHFPGQEAAPGPAVERSKYKKGGPPSELPVSND